MRRTEGRTAFALSLCVALAGCGADEAVETPPVQNVAVEPAATTPVAAVVAAKAAPPAPQLPVAQSAYERAQRALTQVPGMRLETEFVATDGRTQYLSGARQRDKYVFSVRTLPEADNSFDGSWMFQSGRYLKQEGQSFDQAMNPPNAIAAYLNAVASLPDEESELSAELGALDNADGISCQPRLVDLSKSRLAAQNFTRLIACVDESRALIVKLSAETRIGERLVATLSGYGDTIELPPTPEIKSWDQQYPRR